MVSDKWRKYLNDIIIRYESDESGNNRRENAKASKMKEASNERSVMSAGENKWRRMVRWRNVGNNGGGKRK